MRKKYTQFNQIVKAEQFNPETWPEDKIKKLGIIKKNKKFYLESQNRVLDSYIHIKPGSWLIFKFNGGITIFSDKNFKFLYREICECIQKFDRGDT